MNPEKLFPHYKDLLQNQELMVNLIQGLMDILVVVDQDAVIQFINRAGEGLLGYRACELIGRPIGTIISDENLQFFNAIRDLIRTGESRCCDLHLITHSGEKIPAAFNGSVLRGPDRQLQAVVGVIRDMREVWRLVRELEEAKSGLEEKVRERTADLAQAKEVAEKAYEHLKRTRENLDNVIASMPLGILVLSGDLQVLSANLAFRQILGQPHSALQDEALEKVLPVSGLQALAAEVLAAKTHQQCTITYQDARTLRKRYLRLTMTGLRYTAGDPARFLLIVEDITEQKRAEAALRESEERFRQVTENIHEVFWMTDIEKNRMLYVSPAYEEIWNRTCESLYASPKSWLDGIHPDDRDRIFQAAVTKQVLGKYNEEYRIIRPDGSIRWIHDRAFPIRDKTGTVYRIAGVAQDITQRKQAEENLRQAYEDLQEAQVQLARAEALNRNILMTAQDGVVVCDEKGRILWVNPTTERIFGIGGGKLIGRPVMDLMPERYRKKHHGAVEAFLKAGESEQFGKRRRLEGLRSNGTEFPLEIVLSGFQQEQGWVFTAFIHDRTEEVMAEEAIEKAYRELQETQAHLLQSEKLASIGQLAAGVAHEINNPVGYVKSNLNTLREYGKDLLQWSRGCELLLAAVERGDMVSAAAEARRIRSQAQEMNTGFLLEDLSRLTAESLEGIDRVRQIVKNLREFSHVDEKEQKRFDLNQGIESTLKIVWNELKYKAEVVKDLGQIPEISCYPQQMNQVLMNLLINAAQAIEAKGKIWVRTYLQDGHVVVEVEDTGCGIKPEHLNKIFDPFFTTKPVGKGTGLGLSVSYGIVKKHGGRIEVESEVGKGTQFRVLLPVGQGGDHGG